MGLRGQEDKCASYKPPEATQVYTKQPRLWPPTGTITPQECDCGRCLAAPSAGVLLCGTQGDACPPGSLGGQRRYRWVTRPGGGEGHVAVETGHPLTICSLIWEQGALLFTAAKLLAKALLTAQLLCRACWEVPSRPATARHTGGSLARAWNRLLSSSLAGPRGREGAFKGFHGRQVHFASC